MNDDANRIPTNLRMLMILEALAGSDRPLTPSELGDEIDLPKPTLHRLCSTLEAEGYLIREQRTGRLMPSRRTRAMATGLQKVSRMHIARRMVLKSAASELKETCNIAAPGVGGMTYLDRVDTPWPLRFQLPVGTEVPFHCTASGKLFLSSFSDAELIPLLGAIELTKEGPNSITEMDRFLEEISAIREAGYSWDDQEFMTGMVAVSVAITDKLGRFDCAIAVHGPLQRISLDDARGYLPTLRDAAKRISDILSAVEEDA